VIAISQYRFVPVKDDDFAAMPRDKQSPYAFTEAQMGHYVTAEARPELDG
jgi:hypothetical protein